MTNHHRWIRAQTFEKISSTSPLPPRWLSCTRTVEMANRRLPRAHRPCPITGISPMSVHRPDPLASEAEPSTGRGIMLRHERRRRPDGVSDSERPAPRGVSGSMPPPPGRPGCDALTFDGPVDGGAADPEQLGDLGGAVLAAVHQRHQMGFLALKQQPITSAEIGFRRWVLPGSS